MSISLLIRDRGFAGTIESQVSNGGQTRDDILRGYRGALYMGVGLASLGTTTAIGYVIRTHRNRGAQPETAAAEDQEKI